MSVLTDALRQARLSVEHIRVISQGAAAWNAWRQANPEAKPCFDGVQLKRVNFDAFDFSGLSFQDAQLQECSFKKTRFINCNLGNSTLLRCDLSNAKLIAANLRGTNLTGCILRFANTLTANTRGACLEHIDFRGHDLRSLDLHNVSLAYSNLEEQVLSGLDLTGINMQGANLRGADLTRANFARAKLCSADFRGARFNQTSFFEADLRATDFRKAVLAGMMLDRADLSESDLREADLGGASLTQANLTGARLWKVNFRAWNIAKIVCDYAFWNDEGTIKTQYRTHEFERLYAQAVTIELVYPHRLSPSEIATLPIFIEHLQASQWGIALRLKSIEDRLGGTQVVLVVDEFGDLNPSYLKKVLEEEAEQVLTAQLALRNNAKLLLELREELAHIKERFWPRLLELAPEYDQKQTRTLTIVFMDLKGFTQWGGDELSEKLALFRGLARPVLEKWQAHHPNMEGDSLRVTFRNAAAGLSCACMLQNVLTAAGFGVRVGVELGDVAIVHNEVTQIPDLEGHAVSMAARLEAAAQPGQVLVSGRVRQYSEHHQLFEFHPVTVSLQKSIGDMAKGAQLECYDVKMKP